MRATATSDSPARRPDWRQRAAATQTRRRNAEDGGRGRRVWTRDNRGDCSNGERREERAHANVYRPSPIRGRAERHPAADAAEAAQGLVEEHGAQPLGYWLTDGVISCVLRAPSLEAFCRHHADHGLPCDDVHPIAGADMDLVRAVVAELDTDSRAPRRRRTA